MYRSQVIRLMVEGGNQFKKKNVGRALVIGAKTAEEAKVTDDGREVIYKNGKKIGRALIV